MAERRSNGEQRPLLPQHRAHASNGGAPPARSGRGVPPAKALVLGGCLVRREGAVRCFPLHGVPVAAGGVNGERAGVRSAVQGPLPTHAAATAHCPHTATAAPGGEHLVGDGAGLQERSA